MYVISSKLCNLSIIVPMQGCSISNANIFLDVNADILSWNGCEVLFFIEHSSLEEMLLKRLEINPFNNWKIIKSPQLSLFADIGDIMKFCVFDWILELNFNTKLLKHGFKQFLNLSNYYNCDLIELIPYVKQNFFDTAAFGQNPLFIKKEVLSKICKSQQVDSVKTFVLASEYFGYIRLKIINGFFKLNVSIDRSTEVFLGKPSAKKFTLLFSYQNKVQLGAFIPKYLEKFNAFELSQTQLLSKKYRLIVLVAIYNESKHVKSFLNNLSDKCDGIIMLDDGSDDSSYSEFNSDKLILKVQKQRECFDDLHNRNTLLELAFFFNVDWLMFLDLDERIDDRFEKIEDLLDTKIMVYNFNFVNIWNNPNLYRKDLDVKSVSHKDGIFQRFRLFKSIGFLAINPADKRRLHFPPVPYLQRTGRSKILIHHLGMASEYDRKRKYEFYIREDNNTVYQNNNYDFLLDKKCVLAKVSEIKKEQL